MPQYPKYKLIDLFAGAGGLTLGFTDSRFGGGFECIFGLDNAVDAVKTHNLNMGAACAPRLKKNRHGGSWRALWEIFMMLTAPGQPDMFVTI